MSIVALLQEKEEEENRRMCRIATSLVDVDLDGKELLLTCRALCLTLG